MTPLLLRDLIFQRNKPEHWPIQNRRRRQKITEPNDQKRTYQQGNTSQSHIPDQIQPRSPTRRLKRCRTGHANPQTPRKTFNMERNGLLESQQEFQALVRKRNQKKREPGSHTRDRELLEYGRAQADSGTSRQGRRSPIFTTTVNRVQVLKGKGKLIPGTPIIPGSFQQKRRSSREKQRFFQPEEKRRTLDEETNELSPRGTQKQKLVVPKDIINTSE
ncbi:hypothetical protein O181_005833 [Austropuccinia psidii MF-1]|uniref:Uncharacterized protein n=1 Tax=Austropuccinia psidii MF-1 TaxID=1389203 RepID=A0A9Q3GFY6_9BASI|nr:hypothetical protein [Austropuccinia psidii MF-1]